MNKELYQPETKYFYLITTLILFLAVGLIYGSIFYFLFDSSNEHQLVRDDLDMRCELIGGVLIEGTTQSSNGDITNIQFCIPETFFHASDEFVEQDDIFYPEY